MAGCLLRKREREQGWQGKPSECLNASFSRSHGGGMTDDRRLVRAGEVPLTVKEGEEWCLCWAVRWGFSGLGAPLPIGST